MRNATGFVLGCLLVGGVVLAARAEEAKPEAEWNRPRFTERQAERDRMVATQMRDVTDSRVLAAMRAVPRHLFVPEEMQPYAYADRPLPIGSGQTISQPYIVAFMTSHLGLTPDKKVLEIGTGSGYQAAVLAELTPHVYTIELLPELGKPAAERLKKLGYDTVAVKIGDGFKGWPEHAPFDAIIMTCAAPQIPPPLLEQLAPGGVIIVPVGPVHRLQHLVVVKKDANGKLGPEKKVLPVAFVPMLDEDRKPRR